MTIRTDILLLRLEFLTLWLIVATQVLGLSSVASLLFTLTFPMTLGLWLVTAAKEINRRNQLVILIVLLSGLHVCLNALLTGTLVSFSYCKKMIMFWSTILLFGVVGEYAPTAKDVRFLLRGNSLLSLFLIVVYAVQQENMYLLNGIVTGYLTFQFTNPNLTSVFLSAMCMVEFICAAANTGCRRLFHGVLGGAMGCFVFLTQSRNTQLLLVIWAAVVLLHRRFPDYRPGPGVTVVMTLFPLLFALGYLLLVSTPWVQQLFSFLIAEGKNLDSRVLIWGNALAAYLRAPLFGAYSQISEGTGASQMHNTHLDLLASYGTSVFLLVCVLLYPMLRSTREDGGLTFLCRMAFYAMLLSGIGEAILFSGGIGIYLYAGMLAILANFRFEETGVLS